MYDPRRALIYKDKYIWAQEKYYFSEFKYYKLYLSAPSVYNVQSGGVYHSSKSLPQSGENYPDNVLDSSGNIVAKLKALLDKVSALSMGVTATRDNGKQIWTIRVNPEDNSLWYTEYYDKKINHISSDLNEQFLYKNTDLSLVIQAIDSDRKHIWAIGGDSYQSYYLKKICVLNYLGNTDFQIENPDFDTLNSLKLFLPKIFTGYPVAKVDADVTKGNYPLTVIFSATNSYDVDGTIVDYAWDFNGDGVFDLRGPDVTIVTNTYDSPGKFSVMMKVTDDDGLQNYNSDLIIGVGPLTVNPTASPTSGVVKLNVTFSADVIDGLGNGNMENYQWDFDDDGVFDYVSLTTPDTTYTYTKSGDYNARIKVLSKAGEFAEATVAVHVEPSIPTCSMSINPSTITNAQQVRFWVSYYDNGGTIAMFNMDLDGDGIFEYKSNPNTASESKYIYHYYSQPGIYKIKAFVIDNEGNHSTTSEVQVTYTPSDYELVVSPQEINAVGSVVCTTMPSVISIAPDELTWTVKRHDYSNVLDETYLTTTKTETRLDIDDLNLPGAYRVLLSYPPLQKDFTVYSPGEPIARFTATPESGFAPLKVDYDASASSSASGITKYEWDFDSAYFYDDAEADYGIFYGDGRRTTEYAYEGNYSWLLTTPGGLGTHYYTIPDNNMLKISFYTYITNMASVKIKLTVIYDNTSGGQTSTDYLLSAGTNWNENIIIHSLVNYKPGGNFLLNFYSVYSSMPVYIDNILVTKYGNEFNPNESSALPTTTHTFQDPGTYNSLLRVTDANGNKCYANKNITVSSPPEIKIILPEDGENYGAKVSFMAEAENANHIVAYYWDYTGDGIAEYATTKLESRTYTYTTGGTKTANLYAKSTDGSMLTSSVSFTVTLKTAPEIVGYYISTLKSWENFTLYTDLAVNFNDSDLDYFIWQYNDNAAVTNKVSSESKRIVNFNAKCCSGSAECVNFNFRDYIAKSCRKRSSGRIERQLDISRLADTCR